MSKNKSKNNSKNKLNKSKNKSTNNTTDNIILTKVILFGVFIIKISLQH